MDGASKFVRGDAVAGLAITAVNIIGGLAAGLLRDKVPLATAVENYTLLTIGDGLVSQIPALLVSTAAGIVVTRAAGTDLGTQLGAQIFGNSRVLKTSAAVLLAARPAPGHAAPGLRRGGRPRCVALLAPRRPAAAGGRPGATARAKADEPRAAGDRIQDLLALDTLELEVGFALLPLIDLDKGAELPGRVTALRRQLAGDLGIVLPSVHLRDNLRLDGHDYRVMLRGLEIGKGAAYADRLMALDPSGGEPAVEGLAGVDPAFGLPARWVVPTDRARAEAAGLTLVDPSSVITTHLSELLRKNAHDLVGRQEVQELLAVVSREAPKLVEDVVPGTITLGEVVRVVRGLLREGLSVRDLRTILEAIADAAPRSKETGYLVESARRRLTRQITSRAAGQDGVVRALTLDRQTEEILRSTLGAADGEAALAPDVETARRLVSSLETQATRLATGGNPVVLLAPPDLRRPIFDFGCRFVPDLLVISARELTPGTTVEPAGVVGSQAMLGAA